MVEHTIMKKVQNLISVEIKDSFSELKSNIVDAYSESILQLKSQMKKNKDKVLQLDESSDQLKNQLVKLTLDINEKKCKLNLI